MGDSMEVELPQNGCTVYRCVECSARFANLRSLSFHTKAHSFTFNSLSNASSDSGKCGSAEERLGSIAARSGKCDFGKNGLKALGRDASKRRRDAVQIVSEFDFSKLQDDLVTSGGKKLNNPLNTIPPSTQSSGGWNGAQRINCNSSAADASTPADPAAHTRERSYKISHSADLMAHMCAHTGRLNGERGKSADLNILEGSADITTFPCPECDCTFSRFCHLSRHMNRSHPSGEKMSCPGCNVIYCHTCILQFHKCPKISTEALTVVKNGMFTKTASPVKTEKTCDDDGAVETGRLHRTGSTLGSIKQSKTGSTQKFVANLRKRTALQQQQRKRRKNSTRFANCPVCNVQFRSHWLSAHMLVHEEPASYRCHLCAIPFNQVNAFNWHIKKVHSAALPAVDASELQSESDSAQPQRRGRKRKSVQSDVGSEADTSQIQTVMGDGDSAAGNKDLPPVHSDSREGAETGGFRELESGKTAAAPESSSLIPQATAGSESNRSTSEERPDSDLKKAKKIPRRRRRRIGVPSEFKLFKCQYCSKGFPRSSLLGKHVGTMHEEVAKPLPFFCQFCNARFEDVRNLSMHIRLHSEGKLHSCSFCDKSFTRLFNMETHIRRRHKGLHASSSGQQSSKISKPLIFNKEVHSNEAATFICKFCASVFATAAALGSHVSIKHRTGLKPFACQHCTMSSYNPWNLRLHLAKHARQQAKTALLKQVNAKINCTPEFPKKLERRVKQELPAEEEDNEPSFTMRKSLQILNSMKRAPVELKSYYCQQCRETFPNHTSLKTHNVKVHGSATGNGNLQRKHSKDLEKNELLADVNVRSLGKEAALDPFSPKTPSARKSGGRFRAKGVKSNLSGRCRAAAGEKKFPCQHCPSAFTRRENLRAHLQNKHKNLTEQNSSQVESSAGLKSEQTAECLTPANEGSVLADSQAKSELATGESELACRLNSLAKNSDSFFRRSTDTSVAGASASVLNPTDLASEEVEASVTSKSEMGSSQQNVDDEKKTASAQSNKALSQCLKSIAIEPRCSEQTTVSPPKRFSCQLCNSSFTRNWNLKLHLQSKHKGHKDFKPLMSGKPKARPFSCEYCGASFTRKFSMQLHAKKHEKKLGKSEKRKGGAVSYVDEAAHVVREAKNDSASDSEAVKTSSATALTACTASLSERAACTTTPNLAPASTSSNGNVGNKGESASGSTISEPIDSNPLPAESQSMDSKPPESKLMHAKLDKSVLYENKTKTDKKDLHSGNDVGEPEPAGNPGKSKMGKPRVFCQNCGASFTVLSSLKRHMKKCLQQSEGKQDGSADPFKLTLPSEQSYGGQHEPKRVNDTSRGGQSEEKAVDNIEETNQDGVKLKSGVDADQSGCKENGLPVENGGEEFDQKPQGNAYGQVSELTRGNSQINRMTSESEDHGDKSDGDKSSADFGNSGTGTDFTSGDEQAEGRRAKRVNLRKFVCEVCNASFIREYTLKIHMKKHKKQSPSGCQRNGISTSNVVADQAASARQKHGSLLKKSTEPSGSHALNSMNGTGMLHDAEKGKQQIVNSGGNSLVKEIAARSEICDSPIRESDSGSSWNVESGDSHSD